jgi:hypothetical protein
MFRMLYKSTSPRLSNRFFSDAVKSVVAHTKPHLNLQKKLFAEANLAAEIVLLPEGSKLITAPFEVKPHHLSTAPCWSPEILKKFSSREKKQLYGIIRDISPRIAPCQTIGPVYCIKGLSELGVPMFYIAPKYLEVCDDYLALNDILSKEELLQLKADTEEHLVLPHKNF